ncbi:MAG: hypothetical protein IKW00_05595 [Clostridia bacterium]|nr:hypothetical protein [Clostridia bacterium]
MNKEKRFKKQTVNSNADKGMEQGAKALKGGLGLAAAIAIVVKNKKNLKTLGKSVGKIALKLITRS